MTQFEADQFASHWLDTWNSHNLHQIVGHYALNIQFESPFATQLTGSSLVTGRENLEKYFQTALQRFPTLHFSNMRAFPGASSVVLCYRSVNNLDAAETMILDHAGMISHVWAHYSQAQSDS